MMNDHQRNYYHRMNKAHRLLPFRINGNIAGFVTFYITNNVDKFINRDPWEFLDDEEDGEEAYIDQCLTHRNVRSPMEIWNYVKDYLSRNYPNIKKITWVRNKHGKLIRREYYVHSQVS